MNSQLDEALLNLRRTCAFAPVVPYEVGTHSAVHLDLSVNNQELKQAKITPTEGLAEYVERAITSRGATLGYGGYLEERALYGTSEHFEGAEPRTIHLGIDIWVSAGTPIFSPLDGKIHSFQENKNFLDYGPTILIEHDLGGAQLITLYGHLSRESLSGLFVGKPITRGEPIASLGDKSVNGGWPPHLHFQLIVDPGEWKGDYPGVGERSKLDFYRQNCPDPMCLLPWA
ncbi:MAG: peptidoglycan DD-metalloendopeptidase family protein [Bdellovibrionota bacterium]